MNTDSHSADWRILRVGYVSALISFLAATGYALAQIAQVVGLVQYPIDAILIYGISLAIAAPFMIALLALHYLVPVERRFWTHAALLFAAMYNVFVTIMYVVQLAAVIPYDVKEVTLTVQPHSLFWTLDALGYLSMGVATLFASFALARTAKEKTAKYFLVANALTTPLVGFVYFYPSFSVTVLLIATPWIVTAPGAMLALARYYRAKQREVIHAPATEVRFSASLKIS